MTLHGDVAVGGTDIGGGNFPGDDSFAGSILGFAAFDSPLSATELKEHSDAFFGGTVVPEPATWTLVWGFGIVGLMARRRRPPAGKNLLPTSTDL